MKPQRAVETVSGRWALIVLLPLLAWGAVGHGRAAVLYTENFAGGANGWGSRDSIMTVTHQTGISLTPSGAMQGSFGGQMFPVPQTDAFAIDSGTDFLGDYSSASPNPLTKIRFALYADDVLPSDLFIRLVDGLNVFSYQFSLAAMGVDTWTTFTAELQWSFGWSGVSESAFNTMLGVGGVDKLEFQLTRNGTGAQSFYLDNVETLDEALPGAGDAVPEPGAFQLALQALITLLLLRRGLRSGRFLPGPA